MNLNQLKYFLAVAETNNFTQASHHLFISQSSLSVGIQKLEKELGVKLFERTKKQIFLTSEGKYFQQMAKEILNKFETAKTEMRSHDCHHEIIRIGLLSTLSPVNLAELISNFGKTYSNLIIEQLSGNNIQLEKWLEKGDIDLAITIIKEHTNTNNSRILFQENYSVAVAKSHPLGVKKSLSFCDLQEFPYIDWISCEVRDHLQKLFATRGIHPKICYRTTNDELCNALVAAGIGLTVMPARISRPGIVHLPFEDLDLTRQVGLVWKPKHNSKAVNLFCEFCSGT